MDFLNDLLAPVRVPTANQTEQLLLTLLVAFIVGQFSAWCYRWTHRGVSYSRTFTQALVLISIIAALSMFMVASNPLVALGLLGGMAIIRFRTVVRDARDTSYVFLSLICGMACGFGYHGLAVIGAAAANLVAAYLHWTGFGAWHAGDGMLRLRIDAEALRGDALAEQLARFCRRCTLISMDESTIPGLGGAAMCQCAYKIRLRDPAQAGDMIAALKSAFRVEAVHLLVEQEYEEVA